MLLKLLFNSPLLNDLLYIDDPNLEQMIGQIYPTELQSDNAYSFDTDALFWTTLVHVEWHRFMRGSRNFRQGGGGGGGSRPV